MNFFEKKLPENLERNVFWCTFASVLKPHRGVEQW